MLTPRWIARLADELVGTAAPFLRRCLPESPDSEALCTVIHDFLALYPRRPVSDNRGGSGFHNCFWLYVVVRALRPALIIESGVWKGQTTWLLRAAAPDATIHAFDPDLSRLMHRDPDAAYHPHDWVTFELSAVDAARSLCFFDDHIDQARRVREAHARGFRHLIFDDAPPVHKLFSFGYPGTPTIPMLLDDTIAPGDVAEWEWRGESRRWVCMADPHNTRRLIARCEPFPDVSNVSHFETCSYSCWVELA